MSDNWPPPILRERQNNLGWMALSPPEDVVQIGVPGGTEQEAAESYAVSRRRWQSYLDEIAAEAETTR